MLVTLITFLLEYIFQTLEHKRKISIVVDDHVKSFQILLTQGFIVGIEKTDLEKIFIIETFFLFS